MVGYTFTKKRIRKLLSKLSRENTRNRRCFLFCLMIRICCTLHLTCLRVHDLFKHIVKTNCNITINNYNILLQLIRRTSAFDYLYTFSNSVIVLTVGQISRIYQSLG